MIGCGTNQPRSRESEEHCVQVPIEDLLLLAQQLWRVKTDTFNHRVRDVSESTARVRQDGSQKMVVKQLGIVCRCMDKRVAGGHGFSEHL
eukprot:7385944-Prymnesium_polylepis.1